MSALVNGGSPQLFKYLYPEEGWANLVSSNRPFLGMVPKGDAQSAVGTAGTNGFGSGIIHVWNYSNPQAVSMDYGSSLAQQDSQVTGRQILVQLSQIYGHVRLNSKEIAASASRLAAYMSTKKMNFDQVIEQIGLELDLALHRAGNGIIGTVATVVGSVITLTGVTSVQQFQNGMRIQNVSTAPVDGTPAALVGGSALVTRVATQYTGTGLSVTLTLDNPATFAPGQFIVRQGNALGFSGTNPQGNVIGMGAWVPTVFTPGQADNFLLQIDRNADVARLTGHRLSANGRTYREAIQEMAAVIHSFGGRPDTVLLNPIDWQKANIELQQFARYEDFTVGKMAFKALVIASPAGGDLRLMSDPNQDVGVVRVLTLDTWKLWHMGDLVHTIMEDGLELRKDPATDSFQVAMRSWPQLVCFDPRANGVILF